ncbi:MAG: nitroreductase family protein [Actinobacteria bacterium]|nr:nitroreductase family protein [Actinomycetota bacterium]
MELDEVVARRRMCRSFSDRPVAPEALDRAFALATHAPSAGNTQGWAFVVLEGPETERFWRHTADPSWLERPDHPGLLLAPVVVLPLANQASYLERYSEPDKAGRQSRVERWQVPYWLVDTAFATMLLLLGLRQEGLGALFFALHRPAGPLLEQLGVPAGWEPLGAVALGWPAADDKPGASASRPRKPIAQVVHRGGWHPS